MFETFFKYPREAFAQGELVFVNVADPRIWIVGAVAVALVIAVSVLFGARTRPLAWWKQSLVGILQVAVALGVVTLLAGPHLLQEVLARRPAAPG